MRFPNAPAAEDDTGRLRVPSPDLLVSCPDCGVGAGTACPGDTSHPQRRGLAYDLGLY